MSDEPAAASAGPPAGWYPEGGSLRWWDGRAWTAHRAVPLFTAGPPPPRAQRWRQGIAGGLLVTALLCGSIAGFAVMGDPSPGSRIGLTRRADGTVALVIAACPAERLREVTLGQGTSEGDGRAIWQIQGDVPLPPSVVLGGSVEGMTTLVPLRVAPGSGEQLTITELTSELGSPYPMDFSLDEVPESPHVLSFGRVYAGRDEFERAVRRDTPCGDPYWERRPYGFSLVMMCVALVIGTGGVSLLAVDIWLQRRRAP